MKHLHQILFSKRALFAWLCASAMVVAAALAPGAAYAQDAVAQALFDEGKRLQKQGKTAAACEKFASSEEAKPSTGALLNLAACHKKLGKTATAWAEFKQAISRARVDGRQDRVDYAQQQVALLEPLLSKVVLSASNQVEGLAGLSILLDDGVVPPASLGTELPIDPGSHSLRVSAAGHKPWSKTFTVTGNNQRQDVRLPPLEALNEAVTLIIGRVPSVAKLSVSVDGREVAATEFGRDISLAPGKHQIKATAPGYGSWTKTVTLDQAGEGIRVDIPDLSDEEVTARPAAADKDYSDAHTAPALPARRPARSRKSGLNVTGISGLVVAGVGASVIAGGIVAGLVARNQAQTSLRDQDLCPSYKCTERGWDYITKSKENAQYATILVPTGGALVLAGLGMMLFSGTSSDRADSSELPVPYYALDEFGLRYKGAF